MTMGLSAADMDAFESLSGTTNAQSVTMARASFVDLNEDAHRWVMAICRGIQLMAEGAYKPLQNYLQEQKSSKDQSVNFVAELCRALQMVYNNVADGGQWLTLVDQLFDSITGVSGMVCQSLYYCTTGLKNLDQRSPYLGTGSMYLDQS